jgi:tetratricopeptide (TPR) repeat protein
MADEGLSLQDIIKRRQQSDFVGREKRLLEFSENLRLPLADHRRRFVFNVHGVAGVGKTFLTHQFRRVAEKVDSLCAYTDESCFDVLETMTALAADFAAQELPLKSFDKKLAVYHRRRHELEADPSAPGAVTRSAVEIGLAAARMVPVVGGAAGALDARATADQVDRLRAHLSKKLRNSEDVQLLLSPAESLSKYFVADLRRLAHDRPIALFFDTFERTAPFLEDWLLDLLSSRHGELPAQLVITIAGQKSLNSNRWSPYRGIVADVPLVPFTEDEARKLLTARGVRDEHVVQLILTLSGRLPLWLATLADRPPADQTDVTDPTDGAVERFLKWEPDVARRAIALSGALPRKLNEDVMGALCDNESSTEMFGWLRGLPFVTKTTSYWRYHDVARAPMLRLHRTQSPQRWRGQHHKLAAHFRTEREALPVRDDDAWLDAAWVDCRLEESYHEVCADPVTALPNALGHAVFALWDSTTTARRWAEMLVSAGQDSDIHQARTWGRRLTDAIEQNDDSIAYLTALIDDGELDAKARKEAIRQRARAHRDAERYETALQGFDQAIELDPEFESAIAGRGETYRLMNRNDEALADLTRAIELDPSDSWSIGSRGQTYYAMGSNDSAIADLTRAIELDPTSVWTIGSRGRVHAANGDYELAIADYNRALELDPTSSWYIALRGDCHRMARRHTDAVMDLTRAIELDPTTSWPIASRGKSYLSIDRLDDALTDFDRAIELDESYQWAIAYRGFTHLRMGSYDKAVADLDRAIDIAPDDESTLAYRGEAFRLLRRYDDAIADYTRAIELAPDYSWAIASRGQAYAGAGDHERAVSDLTLAIELNPGYRWAFTDRAASYRLLRRYDDAIADYTRVIDELDARDSWSWAQRGVTHRMAGRPAEAIADLTRAMELEPDSALIHSQRGYTMQRQHRHEEALADLTRAIELKPEYDWALATRGRTLRMLARYQEAIIDLSRAIELDPGYSWALSERSEVYLLSGNREAATADINLVVELRPTSSWARYTQGLARGDDGETDIRAAIGLAAQRLQEDPSTGHERFNIAVYHAALHEYDEAAKALLDALRRSPRQEHVMDVRNDLRDLAVLHEVDQGAVNDLIALVEQHQAC